MAEQTTTLIQTRPGTVPRPVAAPPPANWEQGLINRRNSCEFQLNSMFGLLWVPVLAVYLLLFPVSYSLTLWMTDDCLYRWYPNNGRAALIVLVLFIILLHLVLVWGSFLLVRLLMHLRVQARVRQVITRLSLSDLALMIADPQHPATQAALGINRRAGIRRLRLAGVIDQLATRFDRFWTRANVDRDALQRANDWVEEPDVRQAQGILTFLAVILAGSFLLSVMPFLLFHSGLFLLVMVWHSRLVTRNANLIAICDYLAANDSSRYLQGWRMYV